MSQVDVRDDEIESFLADLDDTNIDGREEVVRFYFERWRRRDAEGAGDALPAIKGANDRRRPEHPVTTKEFVNELGNRIRITIEGPQSTIENVLTPLEVERLQEALANHNR